MKKVIVLGITGSIAAHKVIELIERLKNRWDIFVIMTPAAAQMVPAATFEKITRNPVYIDLFPDTFTSSKILQQREVDHITIAQKADVFVVVPATANTIAKIAHGIADNFLTSCLLATKAPVIICPAMNTYMWENKATRGNITTLRSFGYRIVEPTVGMLACGYEGKGKLENITAIAKEIEYVSNNTHKLFGKKILITAGATKENIDTIRYITNPSSGKMGLAIAEAAFQQGADVLLLRAEDAVAPSLPLTQKTFTTPNELASLLQKHVKNFDYLFHTAAVGDFKVVQKKIGKLSSQKSHTITLSPQEKIINTVKQMNKHIHLVGFKAEYGIPTDKLLAHAKDKLRETNADCIVANDVSKKDSGFASDNNEVYVVFPEGTHKHISYGPKKDIARELLALVFSKKG